jgi:hypothetical protein
LSNPAHGRLLCLRRETSHASTEARLKLDSVQVEHLEVHYSTNQINTNSYAEECPDGSSRG